MKTKYIQGKLTFRSASAGRRGFAAGVALIEAMVALVVLFLAFATILGFHGSIVGSAAQNRLSAAAMSLAQEQIEWLRGQRFDSLVSDSRSEVIVTPSVFGQQGLQVGVNVCWTVADAGTTGKLKDVQVWVVRTGTACGTAPPDEAVASLRTLVVENNVRLAALRASLPDGGDADGLGEILDLGPNPEEWPDEILGEQLGGDPGFKVVKDPRFLKDENAFVILDTATGKALAPTNQTDKGRLFATINGMIFLSGRRCSSGEGDIDQRCGVRILTEGNALCRLGYPQSPSVRSPAILKEDGVALEVGYLTYSCVVADQWRRSILLLPLVESGGDYVINGDEKICVGHPGLLLDPNNDPIDVLKTDDRFPGRYYDGRSQEFDLEGNLVGEVPHGIKGGLLNPPEGREHSAVIGSFCAEPDSGETDSGETDSCWADEKMRGLVPGGHHFLVMGRNEGNCSERMLALADLDDRGFFGDAFNYNPGPFFCTSDKFYKGTFCGVDNASPPRPLLLTRLSGFVGNTGLDNHSFIYGTGYIQPTRARTCSVYGPFGEDAGAGFACIVRPWWGDEVDVDGNSIGKQKLLGRVEFEATPRAAAGYLHDANEYQELAARDYALDLSHLNFRLLEDVLGDDGGNDENNGNNTCVNRISGNVANSVDWVQATWNNALTDCPVTKETGSTNSFVCTIETSAAGDEISLSRDGGGNPVTVLADCGTQAAPSDF